jgi:hypothetical protein
MFTEIIDYHTSVIAPLHEQYIETQNSGGKVRGTVGKLYETIAHKIVKLVDPTLVLKKNDYILIPSRSGRFYKKTQVDWHVYKNGELILIIEGKTYLDSSMLDRACSEFEKIRRVYPIVKACIFTGQYDVAEETANWFADECEFDVFVVNETKKRRSDNPIYETKDSLSVEDLQNFYDYVKNIADNA